MGERGHHVTFYEKDVQYYRDARDLEELPGGGTLRLYDDLAGIRAEAQRALSHCDLALYSSYCPDGGRGRGDDPRVQRCDQSVLRPGYAGHA